MNPENGGSDWSEALKAERLVVEMLKAAGWTEEDLSRNRKGHAVKIKLGGRLRGDTTAGWKWIAERLKMGHWRSAANAVRAAAKTIRSQYAKMHS